MNFLEVVMGTSPGNLPEAGSGAWRGRQPENWRPQRVWLSMVLKARAASRTTVRGAKKGPRASYSAFSWRLRVQSIIGTMVGKQTL